MLFFCTGTDFSGIQDTFSHHSIFIYIWKSEILRTHSSIYVCIFWHEEEGSPQAESHMSQGSGIGEMSEEPGLMDTLTISFFIHLLVWNIMKTIGVGVNSNSVAVVCSKCMSDGK